jgi:hypothetical protein
MAATLCELGATVVLASRRGELCELEAGPATSGVAVCAPTVLSRFHIETLYGDSDIYICRVVHA